MSGGGWRATIFVMVVAVAGSLGLSAGGTDSDKDVDPGVKALADAVGRGSALFADASFGTSGKSCSSCHADPMKAKLHLASRVGDYPKLDKREERVVTLGTKINQMIERMLKVDRLELGSTRLVDLEAYLMSLARVR